ncbi:HNH endonuclease [Halorubrum lipolyticum]|uniref:HNH endonuclease n=1 Tax=Halorubrum lipolyticum TaxID=368624 RepID=UPI0011CB38C9|nr:HNH endonuclease [Halorubrum lipolyticum]
MTPAIVILLLGTSMSSNKLQDLYEEYRSTYPRPEPVETEFCEEVESLLDSEGLKSETYEMQIRRLHERCEQKIEAGLVAKAIGCSLSYARRFSYSNERGAFQKEWSKSTQNEKVSPGARTKIINRDGKTCLRCGLGDERELEVHHILPVSQGGTNEDSNLATLCSHCHEAAHDGSKTSGKTAYVEGNFYEWTQKAEIAPEERDLPLDTGQKRISDY